MRIDTAFLALAGVCLIVGACLGIYMGINEDFQLVAVHAHVNLAGWVQSAPGVRADRSLSRATS